MPTLSLDFTAGQAQRLAVAFGKYLNLRDVNGAPRDATVADVKAYLIEHCKSVVHRDEHAVAAGAITETPFEPT